MEKWTRKIFGIALGNTLVLYDFILYGFLGSTLSQLFFPMQTPFVALMSVFLIYASACLMRPFGALFFGLIGDKFGRKASLISSILLMSGSSVLMGCLPTYQSIGGLSVLFLVLLRVIQGFSISGEEVGSAIYLIESAPESKKSLAGSIVLASVHAGLFFGASIIWLSLAFISHAEFLSWGWRLPFLMSLPISLIVLYFRLKQDDSKAFESVKHEKGFSYPLKQIFRHYKLRVLVGILICGLSTIGIYLYAIFIPNYLKVCHHFSLDHVLIFNMFSFIISALSVLLIGYWGDKVGLIKPMRWASIAYIVLSPVAFTLSANSDLVSIVVTQLLFIIIVALASGTLMALLNSLFPIEIRFTGVAICFNFSMILLGSTAPMVSLTLQKLSLFSAFPAIYMVVMGVVVWVMLKSIKLTPQT